MIVINLKKCFLNKKKTLYGYTPQLSTMSLSECIQHQIVPLYTYQHPDVEEVFNVPVDLPLSFSANWTEVHADDNQMTLSEIAKAIGWWSVASNKQLRLVNPLAQYGHLRVVEVGESFNPSHTTSLGMASSYCIDLPPNPDETALAFVDSICGGNVICASNVKYKDIVALAWEKLKPQWGKQKICNLALRISQEPVNSSFNAIRKALYDLKPELKGTLKSSEILDSLDLTQVFRMSDFKNYGDEVVSEVFDKGLILSEILEGLCTKEVNGRTYLCLQSSIAHSHSLNKIYITSPSLHIDWACKYKPETSIMDMYPMQPEIGKNNLKNLRRDREMICKLAGVEATNKIPIPLTMWKFDTMIEDLSDRVVHIRVGNNQAEELGTLRLEFTNGFCELIKVPNITTSFQMNTSEIKDALHKLGVSRTGNKEELVEKLILALTTAYEDKEHELQAVFGKHKGIVLSNQHVGSADKHGMRITNATKCCRLYDNELINRYLVGVFFSMHIVNGAIFDPEYDGALFSVMGLIESMTQSANPECFVLPRVDLLNTDRPKPQVKEPERATLFPG